uniref:Uncharacterized protein n=1 Tax=Oryza nivara TaxID=4536 RepID=A0A0E0IEB2_ORYNI
MASSSRPEEAAAAAPPWSRLEGRVVLVTGASSGLGREFCLDLARAGCLVVAAARRADRLRSLCDEINASAPRASAAAAAVELDVASGGPALEAAVQSAWDAFGRIDVLINNAGLRGGVHSPLDWPEDEWETLIKTNLTGSWLVAKHLMALELGAYGIRVNSIAPGIFKSEITAPLLQKKWLSTVVSKIVPLKTHGTTDPALTSLVRFLIHETSSYVTGNIFIVDSGATLPGYRVKFKITVSTYVIIFKI